VVTDCSIKTLEPDDTLDFNFNSANVVNKVIIKVPQSNVTCYFVIVSGLVDGLAE